MENIISVKYQGKNLEIPYRVHDIVPPDFVINLLPLHKRINLYAKLTRHHDGFIREKYIVKLINQSPELSIPYAIQLASEYVQEIIAVIYSHRELFERKLLKNYIEENQVYLNKSKDRMISYWDCYYRLKNPLLKSYVGFKLFRYFNEQIPNK